MKLEKILLKDKSCKSFCNFAISSKRTLEMFTDDKNLFNIYIKRSMDIQSFMKGVISNIHMFQYHKITQTNLVALLQEFENRLREQNIDETFILQNYETLSSIKFELEYILKEPNVRKNNGKLIGFRDRIFKNLLSSINVVNDRKKVTDLFDEFIKGITYFSNQQRFSTFQPAYHRESSCSRKGEPNKKCTSFDKRNSSDIERCYIERLIYDEMWNHMMNSQQDANHVNLLQDTKMAYTTCFPKTEIKVTIIRFHENNPITVEILKKNGTKVKKEIYTHLLDTSSNRYFNSVNVYREYNGIITTGTNTLDTEGTLAVLYGGKTSQKIGISKQNP